MNEHHHHHHVDANISTMRLFLTMMLNLLITVVELVGGIFSGSLALVSDALHNLSDAGAIVVSYLAIRMSKKPRSNRYTFGLKRAEILAALINATVLAGICCFLIKEAIGKLFDPEPIKAGIMVIVAFTGLFANIVGTLLLKKGAEKNMNMRSAYLHLLSDAVASFAVLAGGVCVYLWNTTWIDPVLTIAISLYIIKETVEILKEAVNVLMMGAPENADVAAVRNKALEVGGIKDFHHLHLWRLNDNEIYLEAHVQVDDMRVSETEELSDKLKDALHQEFEITHFTLQFEVSPCHDPEPEHE